MTRAETVRLGGALLLGAALAFPLATLVLSDPDRRPTQGRAQSADAREVFSPNVRNDPYVRQTWDGQAAALEAHCARTGEMCAEARAARAALERLEER